MFNFGKQKTLFSALAKFSASAKKCNVDACVYPAAGRWFLICLFGWQWPPSPLPICFAIAILDQQSFLWRWSHSQAIERQIGCTQLGYWLQWIVSLRAFLSKLDDFPVLSSSTSCHCQCHAGALKSCAATCEQINFCPLEIRNWTKLPKLGSLGGASKFTNRMILFQKKLVLWNIQRGERLWYQWIWIFDISENPHFVFEQVMRFPQTPVLIGWKTRCVCICSNLLLCWRVKLSTLSSCICSTKFLL